MQSIYLDYNATTPLAPEVREAMLPFLAEQYGNPSSAHALGRAAREAVEGARRRVARLVGAQPDEIVFTSGGTESNNLALVGTARKLAASGKNHLVISALEHPATVEPARYLESCGYTLSVVEPTRRGVVEPEAIEAALRPETFLVSIIHANNEIGTIQPISAIARKCHARGVLVHTDAAQSVGKIPTDVAELQVDLLSIAGHKLYAPKGIGALYVRQGTPLAPVLRGAGQERGLRPGTENVASIVGLGRAASLVADDLSTSGERLATLRDMLLERLRAGLKQDLQVNGVDAERLPNTLSINFPHVHGDELLRQIPELCASTGAACHSGATHISATLAAIGLDVGVARGTVRLSVGRYTTTQEVELAANLLVDAWHRQHSPPIGVECKVSSND